jgi:ferrochelatase
MTRYSAGPDFAHDDPDRIGVLITNLGTPATATTRDVRRFLAEFLSDPRVVEVPRAVWWLILHGVILRIRPARSARAYRAVWSEKGSPLMVNSRHQRDALSERLTQQHPTLRIALGMRYGEPSIESALEELRSAGSRRVLVLPLYPQYSATTTASTFDAVAKVLQRWRWIPGLRFVTQYHDHPAYIEALAQSVRETWSREGRAARLLFSFHGIPLRYFHAGDPYHCQCQKTARLTAQRLGLAKDEWCVSFQSRVGREEWLQPYTDQTLESWGRGGIESVQALCPGFAADCLETLEEIDQEYRRLFVKAGGKTFSYIPALNDRPAHLDALSDVITGNIGDWLAHEQSESDPERRARATALGARR